MVNKLAREDAGVKKVLGKASKTVFDQLRCQNSWWNLFSRTVQEGKPCPNVWSYLTNISAIFTRQIVTLGIEW